MKAHELIKLLSQGNIDKDIVIYDENHDVLLDLSKVKEEYDEETGKYVMVLYTE
ncbi:hypothetical protein PQE70_gp013 [Bacillus phage vB_BanS_Nate]|uniref:Uncharacterized protein n=1 Tax=Bacillus phage vB_BanS_Nate TaxID=2894788 RepID=A0AAE9CE94_9CAUD|nr:hypothetical protein PQE70_gp013 [Bacillus phage vB_BanS_Nate]UGO50866.1 hypothetical protein NATE_13 [Bacillus phage vB_BanS_Nate]